VNVRVLLAGLTILLSGGALRAQITGDVLGMHALGPGTKSPISGARPDACSYCHAPHSALNLGLWNQKLTTQTYSVYTSDTEANKGRQPTLGYSSNQCLSCHDGSVAVGNTVVYGQVTTQGSMSPPDVFGANMQTSHPFSLTLPLKDNIDLVATLATAHKTADTTGAVKLIYGNVECISCHNPHVQAKDLISQNFLVKDSSSGQLCLACHDPTRQISGQVNPLADWPVSAHAQSTDQVSAQAQAGSYSTVSGNACISCHAPHDGAGMARLLRGQNEQDCIACHNGANVSGMPAYANVFSEYASNKIGHPFPTATNPHDAAEGVLVNSNRHATCVDCHNSHGSQIVGAFPVPPALRISQKDIAGINESDGVSVLTPAINQYQNCLRCHGTSTGKQALATYGYLPVRAVSGSDPLNVISQFAVGSTSSHAVMQVSTGALPQPSLLGTMLNLNGGASTRVMTQGGGTQILCTDCHNSDDNREFGGSGPNGPHGSVNTHILERQYQFSQAPTPGATITNLYPNPDLTFAGPYAMCAKCHDLANQIIKNTSFSGHSNHINDGFSCSVCHTAHGMGGTSATISGERLVNFDVNVVAPNGTTPITYSRGTNTCVLVCHGVSHSSTSGGTTTSLRRVPIARK